MSADDRTDVSQNGRNPPSKEGGDTGPESDRNESDDSVEIEKLHAKLETYRRGLSNAWDAIEDLQVCSSSPQGVTYGKVAILRQPWRYFGLEKIGSRSEKLLRRAR